MSGKQSVSIVGGSILQLNQGGYSAFHKNSGWKKVLEWFTNQEANRVNL
jgi:hypothetical protein